MVSDAHNVNYLRLYLINAQNALDRKDHIAASHWFACAELEREESEKEAAADNPTSSCGTGQHTTQSWGTTYSRGQLSYSHKHFVKRTEASDGSFPIVLECNADTIPGDISNDMPIDVAEDELMSDTLTKPNCRERCARRKPQIRGRAAILQQSPHASRQDTENVMLLPSQLNQYVQESVIGIDPGDHQTSVQFLSPMVSTAAEC